jgi:hypothetical protein
MPSAQTFAGISSAAERKIGIYGAMPPDPNGDVGGNYYVQWVNFAFAIYNKNTGNKVYGPVPGSTLWKGFGGACANTNDGDPVVAFDPLAGRWVMGQFAGPSFPSPPFYYCVAVSQTSNPTGKWYRYQFRFVNKAGKNWLDDYAKIGVWSDAYYVTFNEFDMTAPGTPFEGQGVVALDRASMLSGASAPYVYMDLGANGSPCHGCGGMLPASFEGQTPPPGGAPGYFMQMDSTANGYPQDQLELWNLSVDWTKPAKATFSEDPASPLAVDAFSPNVCGSGTSTSTACVPQPGPPGTTALDSIPDRIMYRLQYVNTGSIQLLTTDQTVVAGAVSGIRWYQLSNAGAGWAVAQQGTYAPSTSGGTDWRWMGSAASDVSGDMAVGYSVSGKKTYPTVAYAGRLTSDPAGTLGQGESVMAAGAGSQAGSGRWGDYSSMSLDPSDGCTFWYTQEYYASATAGQRDLWSTVVGHFSYPSCVPIPDTTPPTGAAMTAPLSALAAKLKIPVRWTASDSGSGVASYDVSYTSADPHSVFGSPTLWRSATTATSGSFLAAKGTTYCFTVTAKDVAGNTSAPSPARCASTPVDDRALAASPGWSRGTARGYLAHTYSRTGKRGASLELAGVTGMRFALVATRCPGCGKVSLVWNGSTLRTVNLDAARRKTRAVFSSPALSSIQTGTIQLVVTTSGKPVIVDGLIVGQA